jgi:hypothetical protein
VWTRFFPADFGVAPSALGGAVSSVRRWHLSNELKEPWRWRSIEDGYEVCWITRRNHVRTLSMREQTNRRTCRPSETNKPQKPGETSKNDMPEAEHSRPNTPPGTPPKPQKTAPKEKTHPKGVQGNEKRKPLHAFPKITTPHRTPLHTPPHESSVQTRASPAQNARWAGRADGFVKPSASISRAANRPASPSFGAV